MKKLNIPWLSCDNCGNKNITVYTEQGHETWLYDDDAAKCEKCGNAGLIECDDEIAQVVWNEPNNQMAKQ
ncbi:hypothetical protein A6E13_16405 [Aliivibrio fischeri]|uniref:hypothetical protein n=1 Tax=Aliivibrio fischeri TaxID=668 RepID=UPI00080E7C1F|nr:hypothetical protein [Aliivibrio fischeri]OCH31804.1 hypothetical protein A6E13_16405 [Aliivibrio fischeri]